MKIVWSRLLRLCLRRGGEGMATVISHCQYFGEGAHFSSIHPGLRYPKVGLHILKGTSSNFFYQEL